MEKFTKAGLKRREKRREHFTSFAEWLRFYGMEVNIVYTFYGETDTGGIYDKWLEFMSDYCRKAKIQNSNLPLLKIGYDGGLGENLICEGFELFRNDCDETGKIYVIGIGRGSAYKDAEVILEVKPAALFAKTCIGQKPFQAYSGTKFGYSGTHWDFYNESEKTDVDLYYCALWNRKKGKVLFADWDMGTSTWYFGGKE